MNGQSESITADDKAKRERSSIGFPYMDLKSAIVLADAIHSNVGSGDCADDQLAAWSGQSPKSSTFRVQVASARMFGVIGGDNAHHRLTDLGRQIIDPSQSRAAKVKAFLNVPLYSSVYEKYKGGLIPPTAALERDMVQLGVAQKQKDRARQAFERSAEQAGFFEQGKNRLVQPGVQPGGYVPDPKTPPPPDLGGGNGGGGGDTRDPLIAALIQKLPETGPWGADQRIAWLNLMKMAFQLSYGPVEDITISAAKPTA
jgi:hypothetical protein